VKKLITLSLCIGVLILGIWSYNVNTNINSDKITSLEQIIIKNDTISKILKENIRLKKQAEFIQVQKVKQEKLAIKKRKIIPLYDIPLSFDLQIYIYKTCKQKGIPYEMTLAVIKTESDFNPKAKNINDNGSVDKGLMQINSIHKKWCKELGITDLLDPYQNIIIGTELLSNLYNKYKDVHKTLIAYNMGENGLKRNLKVGRGSTNYSRKVISNINIIKNSR
jgi:soluble lytic murein transglycosylase-like protein